MSADAKVYSPGPEGEPSYEWNYVSDFSTADLVVSGGLVETLMDIEQAAGGEMRWAIRSTPTGEHYLAGYR